jgi:hypothetical protein
VSDPSSPLPVTTATSPATPAAPTTGTEAAKAKIAAIESDKSHAFHRGDMNAIDAMLQLYREAYPEPSGHSPPPPGDVGPSEASPGETVEIPRALADEPALTSTIQEATRDLAVPAGEVSGLLGHIIRTAGDKPVDAADSEATLRGRWGAEYAARLEAAQTFYGRLPLGLQVELEAANFDNDPGVIAQFAAWGAKMVDAERAITAIQRDREHAANNPGHRDHAKARETLRKLYLRAYGSRPVVKTR